MRLQRYLFAALAAIPLVRGGLFGDSSSGSTSSPSTIHNAGSSSSSSSSGTGGTAITQVNTPEVAFLLTLQAAQITSMSCLITLFNMTMSPLGTCLDLPGLSSLIVGTDINGVQANGTAGLFSDQLAVYLQNTCGIAGCSEYDIQQGQAQLADSCQGQDVDLIRVLNSIFANYHSSYRTLACMIRFNGTTDNCLSNTISSSPTANTCTFFNHLVSGKELEQYNDSVFNVAQCTGCMYEMYKAAVFVMSAIRGHPVTETMGNHLQTCPAQQGSIPNWPDVQDQQIPSSLQVNQNENQGAEVDGSGTSSGSGSSSSSGSLFSSSAAPVTVNELDWSRIGMGLAGLAVSTVLPPGYPHPHLASFANQLGTPQPSLPSYSGTMMNLNTLATLILAGQLAKAATTLKLLTHPDQPRCGEDSARACPLDARSLDARSIWDREIHDYHMIDGRARRVENVRSRRPGKYHRSRPKRQDTSEGDPTGDPTADPLEPSDSTASQADEAASSVVESSRVYDHTSATEAPSDSHSGSTLFSTASSQATSQATSEIDDQQSAQGSQTTATGGAAPAETDAIRVPLDSLAAQGVTYTIEIEVGGEVLEVIADTGSRYFWVAALSCEPCNSVGMAVSPITLEPDCQAYNLGYKNSSVTGCLASTSVAIGEYRLEEQELLAVTWLGEEMQRQHTFMSGILGLGMAHQDNSGTEPSSVVIEMFNRGFIKAPTIGFYLDPKYWDQNGESSELTLGVVTESAHVNTSRSVRLDNSGTQDFGHYAVDVDAISVPAASAGWPGGKAVVDTGMTGLFLPHAIMQEVHSSLHPEGQNFPLGGEGNQFALPCNNLAQPMNNLSITLGGQDWAVDYMDLVGMPLKHDGMCLSRIWGLDSSETGYDIILGATFLKNVYSAFDLSDGSVTIYDVIH